MNNVEKAIIELLKKGYSQNEIAENFKKTKKFLHILKVFY